MLKKIVTTAGLVSVFGASAAYGVQNLSAAVVTPHSFASETIGVANPTTGAGANVGTTFFNIEDGTQADLDSSMVTGFVGAPTGANDYYVKVELTNAAFDQAAEAMTVTASGARSDEGTSVLFSGGAIGTSSAIYQFDISAAMTATATLTANFTSLATNGDPTVSISIFETLTEANKAAGTSVSSASANTVKFVPGLVTTVTAATETAEVSTDFKKYITTSPLTGLTGQLGGTTIALLGTGTIDGKDGLTSVLADLYTTATSVVTVSGDLSNGTWWLAATGCANAAAIPTADKLVLNAAKTSGTRFTSTLDTKGFVCNLTDGVAAIPASAYTIAIDYKPGTANYAGPTDIAATGLGSVVRNGTTNQINYLTTFADYNQRVYIGNRGAVDATYSFTFNSETGVTATAGTAATGTSKAGTVLALKASDIVTLTGKTRTAATLSIVGAASVFDISTQQVNLSNGATDTIVYR